MHRVDKKNKMVLVSSEPITFERNDWTAIPTNSLLTILKDQTILLHPIIDEYYQKNPLFIRDSGFSTRKGQMGYIPKDDIVKADGKVIKDNTSDAIKYSNHAQFPTIPPLDSERRDHLI